MVAETEDRNSRDKAMDLLDDKNKTNDESNRTEDSMERNLTEDDGLVTQSDDREAKRIFDSLYSNLTEDDCHPPSSSKNPAELFEKLNIPDLLGTSSFGDFPLETSPFNRI